ncbi:MAG: amino acid adenylation domain-containing protein, partial [Pirellulaceae bacterium]
MVPVSRDGELPLSLSQEALWFLDRLEPERPTYSVFPAFRIQGTFDVPAFEFAVNEIRRRHEAVRTRFPEVDGRPVQVIDSPEPRPLPIVDLTHLPPDQRESEAQRWILEERRCPIDLQNGPLLRTALLRLSEDDYVVSIATHHIIYDGWSMGILIRELSVLYEAHTAGQLSPLPELPIQYADFAVWQRQLLQGKTLERLRNYWVEQLSGVPPLELPTDYPRPAIRTTRGATRPCHLSPELSRQVLEFCRREGVTPFMALLAAFQLLLQRYSGQDDLAVGSPVANRTQPETEPLIGYFINMLVSRTDLSGNSSFRDVVRRTRLVVLDGFDHQDLTLDQVVDAVKPQRDLSRHPLFQAMFVLQNTASPEVKGPGVTIEPFEERSRESTAYFELTLALRETEQGFRGSLNFNTDLFHADTIDRMARHYQMLLERAVAQPDHPLSTLSLSDDSERETLLVDWNDTASDYPGDACIHSLFEDQVERTPNAVALIDGPRQWTYRELNEQANRLAHYLQDRGVRPDQVVAVRLPRSADQMIAIFGILKAGGAYLPLDPSLPADRLNLTLHDAQVDLLVTNQQIDGDLPEELQDTICLDAERTSMGACSTDNPPRRTTSRNLAYVIYTSGSTGRPKGVMIEHRALVNYTHAAAIEYGICSDDRVLQFASVSFDAHAEEIYPCLTRGGTLVLRTEDILEFRDEWRLTVLSIPTGFWHELVSMMESEDFVLPETLRLLIIGGEQASPQRVATWFECVGDRVRLLNTYGPTETTVVATAAELTVADGKFARVPIGRPLANMRAYVLDEALNAAPVGVPGELYIGGESVARGYLNRPDLTDERFVPDPFVERQDGRMYKTGDLVRWRPDGRLEFVGRTDDQVKIRGFRIEPGEVQQVLQEHPSLAEVAVVAREREAGDLRLVAYVVSHETPAPTIQDMRRYFATRVPEFMIPSAFVVLDSLPYTTSGKVDRGALPQPDWSGKTPSHESVAPRTPAEQKLASIWCDVLNVEQVGVHDNFFDLGGNSLLALRLTSHVRSVFSVDLPLVTLFASPTVADLAHQIVALQTTGSNGEKPPIRPVAHDGLVPASFAQERFWLAEELSSGAPVFNMHTAIPVDGELDTDILRDTINEIVRRHAALRTAFVAKEDGQLVQQIAPEMRLDLPVEDLTRLSGNPRAERAREISLQQAMQRFDLGKAPLLEVRLLRLAETRHALIVTIHHIIFDAWSLDVLRREITAIYGAFKAGHPSPLEELPVQYADYVTWQREYLQGNVLESLMGYWRNKLAGVQTPALPTDQPRRAGTDHIEGSHAFRISRDMMERMDGLCKSNAVTYYMLLLAIFKVLLHRYCGSDDIAVASPVANRSQREMQGLIGLLIDVVVLRDDFSGDPTFRQSLARVRQTVLEAFEHQELPFGMIVNELQPKHDPNRFPLVQVLFNFHQQNSRERIQGREELSLEFEHTDAGASSTPFDVTLTITRRASHLNCVLKYDTSLFDHETIERMAVHFRNLLQGAVTDPDLSLSKLPLLTKKEKHQLLVEANRTDVDFPDIACVHQFFEAHAERTPQNTALVFEGQEMTYEALNANANQLAHYLRTWGVGPETLVGVYLERSPETVVALLAVLKAGGAYVPLDPSYPQDRLHFMLADAQPPVLMTTSHLPKLVAPEETHVVCLDADREQILARSTRNLPCETEIDNALCVLYTSGSTGTPKGAVNLHRGLANRILWERDYFGFGSNERVLFQTPLSFDVSLLEVFCPLACGSRIVVARPDGHHDLSYLAELIAREEVTTGHFVPSVLRILLEEKEVLRQCHSLKRVTCGGEALTPDLVELFFQRLDADLCNVYGPTETSVSVTCWECDGADQTGMVPIGRPISNVRIYIVDDQQNPVPVGVPGELLIGGDAVGRGYLNRPELTKRQFIRDPFSNAPDARLYRTGDLCRYRNDGNIEFLGRQDQQVKIHGVRIELGEIEAVLDRHPSIARAAVIVCEAPPGNQRLAAYLVLRDHPSTHGESPERLTESLRRDLKKT